MQMIRLIKPIKNRILKPVRKTDYQHIELIIKIKNIKVANLEELFSFELKMDDSNMNYIILLFKHIYRYQTSDAEITK